MIKVVMAFDAGLPAVNVELGVRVGSILMDPSTSYGCVQAPIDLYLDPRYPADFVSPQGATTDAVREFIDFLKNEGVDIANTDFTLVGLIGRTAKAWEDLEAAGADKHKLHISTPPILTVAVRDVMRTNTHTAVPTADLDLNHTAAASAATTNEGERGMSRVIDAIRRGPDPTPGPAPTPAPALTIRSTYQQHNRVRGMVIAAVLGLLIVAAGFKACGRPSSTETSLTVGRAYALAGEIKSVRDKDGNVVARSFRFLDGKSWGEIAYPAIYTAMDVIHVQPCSFVIVTNAKRPVAASGFTLLGADGKPLPVDTGSTSQIVHYNPCRPIS